MKYWTYILLLITFSCNNHVKKVNDLDISVTAKTSTLTDIKNDICWSGTLNGKTPIFIHYQIDQKIIIGEITYLNTKEKLPIKLLGTIEDDKTYRLLEFEKSGNITGIIEFKPTEKSINGHWSSTKTNKEHVMTLSQKDTLIISPNHKTDETQIFGNYYYQYGENGFNGDFDISKVGSNKVDFKILSLTNVERGPNIAEVEKDTIAMTGNSFVYKIPDSNNCEFKVTFYKDFVYINYTKGYCENQFGLNATIDGLYLKTK